MTAPAAVLPLSSPDFNPIEPAFAKLRALLRRAVIGSSLDAFSPVECAN